MPVQQLERLYLSIGELSRLTGVNIETIRYYERIKLMPRSARTRGGRRTFSTDSCRTLAFIKRGRDLGFSIPDIRTLLSLRCADGPCRDAKAVAQRQLEAVQERHLVSLERVLSNAIGRCSEESNSTCAVLEVLDTDCCQAQACCGA